MTILKLWTNIGFKQSIPSDIDSILAGCCAQERQAQKALYKMFETRVMGICLRYAKSKTDADDIFQESFVKIYLSIKDLQSAPALWSWIKTTTIRSALQFYKKETKYNHTEDIETANLDSNTSDNLAIEHLEQSQVLSLVNGLPEGFRMVFNLYVIDGFSHDEIAQMLGISEGTSKSQLSRAKSHLRDQLKKIGIMGYEKYK
jgi:RNA polymerase sigma factor (sigma-70 family)